MPSITAPALARLLEQGQPLYLLDVRRAQAREASGLQAMGADARHLEGGMAAWRARFFIRR